MKHLHLLVFLMLSLSATHVAADEYNYEFTSAPFSGAGTQSLGGINWTLTTNAGYFGYNSTNGQQIGSKANPATELILSTSGFSGTISEIDVTTGGASGYAGYLNVTVGGNAFGNTYTVTTTVTQATFTGNASGEIKLIYSPTSAKALYIKAIRVVYSPDGNGGDGTITIPMVQGLAAFNALADGTEAQLYLGDEDEARVTFVYGKNAYIRDNSGAICFYGFDKMPAMAYNQHIAGYITGQKSTVGNMPVLKSTANTNTTLLAIAEPVTEPNVEPRVITSAEQSQHYADWVTINNITMTDANNGTDDMGVVKVVNSFNTSHYTTPVAGQVYTISGIVNSTATDGDRLSPIYNKTVTRVGNPTFPTDAEFLPISLSMGIEGILSIEITESTPVYDLMGRRVNPTNLPKGIYIVNGKKYVK